MAAAWMNTRENIIAKAKPLLEPGEVVAHVVRTLDGKINRWLGIAIAFLVSFPLAGIIRVPILVFVLFFLLFTSLFPRRLILATDRSLVVLKCGRYRWTPKRVIDRLDIQTKIGPLVGFWRSTTLNGRRMYVVPRCYTDVIDADTDVDSA
jgi:hypothetical protein